MQTIELNYDQAHDFVEKNKKNGFYWDGWTIVKWTPNPAGYSQTNGMFRKGRWGYAYRYFLTKKGTWKISGKYAKYI